MSESGERSDRIGASDATAEPTGSAIAPTERARTAIETVASASAEETETAGARVARRLTRGDVVLVTGELGSGKTVFVRGACRALGVEEPVTSPTFTIGQLYHGRLGGERVEIAHLDLFRLASLEPEDPGLVADYVTTDRITFVEWPQAAEPELDRVTARVWIAHAGGDRRTLEIV
jgi:tRNA threonylcarbamoyladenosine biosynthesis protein TsaE